jgi:hypothetical protein
LVAGFLAPTWAVFFFTAAFEVVFFEAARAAVVFFDVALAVTRVDLAIRSFRTLAVAALLAPRGRRMIAPRVLVVDHRRGPPVRRCGAPRFGG